MLMRKCDICGREIRKTEGRYNLVFIGRLYDTNKDVCADCIKRISDEIKQADTPQTEYKKWETPPKFEHKGVVTTCVSVALALITDEPQTDCDHKCIQTEIGCERTDCQWK